MQLEFRVAGFMPNDQARITVLTLIQNALAEMKLSEDTLRKVVIADEENYGPAIKELSAGENYTDDNVYRGIGKNLPCYQDSKYLYSNLVLHSRVIASFAQSPETGVPGEVDAVKYCIHHEMGHSVDHSFRPTIQQREQHNDNPSIVMRSANIHAETILSEYAACFFSAPFLSIAGFLYLADQTRICMTNYLDTLTRRRYAYRMGFLQLSELENTLLNALWRGIVEIAKLEAYQNANPTLNGEFTFRWPKPNEKIMAALNDFGANLSVGWQTYPNCIEAFKSGSLKALFAIAEAEGYKLEVRTEGDYLWLQ